jgi:hypothetical protein
MLCLSLAASLAASVRRCRLHSEQLHIACVAGGGAVAALELDWACSAAAQDADVDAIRIARLGLVHCTTLQPGDAATPQESVADGTAAASPGAVCAEGPTLWVPRRSCVRLCCVLGCRRACLLDCSQRCSGCIADLAGPRGTGRVGLPRPADLSGCYMQAVQSRLGMMILSCMPHCRLGHGGATDVYASGRHRQGLQDGALLNCWP